MSLKMDFVFFSSHNTTNSNHTGEFVKKINFHQIGHKP